MKKANILITAAAFLFFLFSLAPVTNAQFSWPVDPYGGRSYFAIPCTCTLGCIWHIVGPPRPASILWCPLSGTLYKYTNVFPPAWQNGNKGWPSTCDMWVGDGCITIGIGQKLVIDGTSVY